MKKVTVVSGAPDASFADYEEALAGKVKGTELFRVRDMDIKFCCGCWACWVKTPGLCAQHDEMPKLLQSIINSELTVFISPVHMGYVSSLTKKVHDKMIPLIHPYIGIFSGEFHHYKRYSRYPKLGLILLSKTGVDAKSHEIITQVYKRMALNFKSELAFSVMSQGSAEEAEHAVNYF